MKKGYIYITSRGYDPEKGKPIKDPYLGDTPTLGACMTNLGRRVVPGDHIFLISGRVPEAQQFVVGGFEVAEKIDAMAAYERFPRLLLHPDKSGAVEGNIIVDSGGRHHDLDTHDAFERRVEDHVVGRDPIVLTDPREMARGRREALDVLRELFRKDGATPIDVIGRCSRLDEGQIVRLRNWLIDIKSGA
jgi:hypothetical protein